MEAVTQELVKFKATFRMRRNHSLNLDMAAQLLESGQRFVIAQTLSLSGIP
jgi:hypothetical protein